MVSSSMKGTVSGALLNAKHHRKVTSMSSLNAHTTSGGLHPGIKPLSRHWDAVEKVSIPVQSILHVRLRV